MREREDADLERLMIVFDYDMYKAVFGEQAGHSEGPGRVVIKEPRTPEEFEEMMREWENSDVYVEDDDDAYSSQVDEWLDEHMPDLAEMPMISDYFVDQQG